MTALGWIDRVLSPVTWLLAAALAVMLVAGPGIVAHDKGTAASAASPYGGQGASSPGAGKQVFSANCGRCHTLSAAGTSGSVGPKLDGTQLSAADVAATVRSGAGIMPSFKGVLSDAQIAAVAAFVARASR